MKHLTISLSLTWSLTVFVVVWAVQGPVDYSGYKIYRIFAENEIELKVIENFQKLKVPFLSGPNGRSRPADVLLSPDHQNLLDCMNGTRVTEIVSDVESLIRATQENVVVFRNKWDPIQFSNYYRFEPIMSWLKEQAEIHSEIVSTISIGKSYEGRELLVLKVAKPSNTTKKAIWIDGNIHSREWITTAVSLYIIDQMLNKNNDVYEQWIEKFDWYFLPVLNPDGYEFTHTRDRMWRKTMSRSNNVLCKGADANRNWGFHWLTVGASTDPCGTIYAGTKEFSEPETYHTSRFINNIASDLDAFISLHSYGQLLLIPFGVDVDLPSHDHHMEVGQRMSQAMEARYGTIFRVGNSREILYPLSGGSTDWVQGVYNVPLTYTIELRDTGTYGFLLPPDQIIPSGEEVLDGLEAMINSINNK